VLGQQDAVMMRGHGCLSPDPLCRIRALPYSREIPRCEARILRAGLKRTHDLRARECQRNQLVLSGRALASLHAPDLSDERGEAHSPRRIPRHHVL